MVGECFLCQCLLSVQIICHKVLPYKILYIVLPPTVIFTCKQLITDHKSLRFCLVKSSRWSPTGLVLHSIFQDRPPSHRIILNTRYSCIVHTAVQILPYKLVFSVYFSKSIQSYMLSINYISHCVQVTVAIIDLQPEFEYAVVPRMSSHSYLQAVVKNTSSYSILSGPANVFLDNNFIAKVSCMSAYCIQYVQQGTFLCNK